MRSIRQYSVGTVPTSVVPCESKEIAVASSTSSVTVQSQSLVDAYDSEVGGYGGSNVLPVGTVQAATTVVRNGGVIHGNVVQNSTAQYAPVQVPTGAINLPLGASTPGNLNINTGGLVTLPPGNYVVQTVNISHAGELRLTSQTQGPVNIYVLGNLNLGGIANANGSPKNLNFLVVNNGYVNVNSVGPLYGNLYAPKAPVQVNSRIYGSVVGNQVTLNSGAAVHRDTSQGCSAPPPIAVGPPRKLPPPPTEVGCYSGTSNGWRQVECTSDKNEVTTHFPVPEPAIESYANTVPSPILLQYG